MCVLPQIGRADSLQHQVRARDGLSSAVGAADARRHRRHARFWRTSEERDRPLAHVLFACLDKPVSLLRRPLDLLAPHIGTLLVHAWVEHLHPRAVEREPGGDASPARAHALVPFRVRMRAPDAAGRRARLGDVSEVVVVVYPSDYGDRHWRERFPLRLVFAVGLGFYFSQNNCLCATPTAVVHL